MLKKIWIKNYRSCMSTSIDLHPNLTVLIGPNGSGKTNILQAIMLLKKMAGRDGYGRQEEAITVSSGIRARFLFGKSCSQLNASVNLYNDESNNDVVTGSRQRWRVTRPSGDSFSFELPMYIAAHHGDKADWFLYRRHTMRVHRRQAAPEQLPDWVCPPMDDVWRYCQGIRYYGASQFTDPGACPVSFEIEKEARRPHLYRTPLYRAPRHVNVLSQIYLAKKAVDPQAYDRFMSIVGPKGLKLVDDISFREVKTSSKEYTVRVGGKVVAHRRYKLLLIPRFRIGRQQLSPNQLSEGTFKTLALLFFVITEDSSALLIEEPEVCIHQGLLSSILEVIKTYSQHKQMIISTHSDYVLDHVEPENVYPVSYDKTTGTSVNHISKLMTQREMAALKDYLNKEGNLGDYWREGGLEVQK